MNKMCVSFEVVDKFGTFDGWNELEMNYLRSRAGINRQSGVYYTITKNDCNSVYAVAVAGDGRAACANVGDIVSFNDPECIEPYLPAPWATNIEDLVTELALSE